MYENLEPATLKNGEVVQCGLVRGPDPAWAGRIIALLGHKWDPWDWQNVQVLEHALGIDVCFYLLLRQGEPFCNIMIAEHQGVGILGHVFTKPQDRRQHATTLLMARQMDHFRRRGGRMLALGTAYDSPAYHIYRGQGFQAIEARSGVMAWYAQSAQAFEDQYFAPGPVAIEAVDWTHWPSSSPLFMSEFPGVIRCVVPGLLGRNLTEEALLKIIRREHDRRLRGQAPAACVLCSKSGAVVGLAQWDWHQLWRQTAVLDVYCHPRWWDQAPGMLRWLVWPGEARKVIAYADAQCPARLEALRAFGLAPVASLPRWLCADAAGESWVDVTVWEKPISSPATDRE